jgi:hypothetical protein
LIETGGCIMYLQQALELFNDPMTFISCRIEHGNRGMMTMKVD